MGPRLGDSHPLWYGLPAVSGWHHHNRGGVSAPPLPARNPRCATPDSLARAWFRLIPFRSPLLWELFRFLRVLRCFSSPTYLPPYGGSRPITAAGLPHSETTGSGPDCGSPVVSLLVCVLRRLVVPRHPPPAYRVLPGHGSLGKRVQRTRHNCFSSQRISMNLLRCIWWSEGGSNPLPPACKAGGLPTELPPHHDH